VLQAPFTRIRLSEVEYRARNTNTNSISSCDTSNTLAARETIPDVVERALREQADAEIHRTLFASMMELIEHFIASDCYTPWGGHPTPESTLDPGYSPSDMFSSVHLSVYVDQNNLEHPSIKPWSPASSTDLSDENPYTEIVGTSSQVLERIRPIESDSFGSAEEMFKVRDEQTSVREYSLRQTYSFLNEISSSGIQDSRPTCAFPGKQKSLSKPSRKTSVPSDDTWSLTTPEADAKYISSFPQTQLSGDARKTLLNKNKLAAAKCRVNKNIQTNKLRESVHTVVAANNRLRQEVMDKMEEIQALHTEVLCHAVNNRCRDPHELRRFLCSDEGRHAVPGNPARSEEPHAPTTERSTAPDIPIHDPTEGRTNRRRSDAPSPSCVVNRFKHESSAHQRAGTMLSTRHLEP
jgi:hypothetical protein